MTPYRISLPPPRPIRRRKRRFTSKWLAAWQSLLFATTTYSFVAGWVVHATLLAMLLRFEAPNGELCLCGGYSQWHTLEWFRVLRTVTSPW